MVASFGLAIAGLTGCGEDPALAVAELFTIEAMGAVAPPGRGPDDRLVIASRPPGAQISTFDVDSGVVVDPPFTAFPTEQGALQVGRRLAVVTPVGRFAVYELDGTQVALAPSAALGRTGPLVAGPSNTARVVTTSGRLVGIDVDGNTVLDAALQGAGVGAPVVTAGGDSIVSTDLGNLQGFASDGTPRFTVPLAPPLSPPALVGDDLVVVVTGDGISGYGLDGSARFEIAGTSGLAGVLGASDGSGMAWSTDGRLVRFDSSGSVQFEINLATGTRFPPVALPEGRAGWVGDDGVARTIGSEGTVVAERALAAPPTGPALQGTRARAYIPMGNRVVAVDFALIL